MTGTFVRTRRAGGTIFLGFALGLAPASIGGTPWPWRWAAIAATLLLCFSIICGFLADRHLQEVERPGRRAALSVITAVLTSGLVLGVPVIVDHRINRPVAAQLAQRWGEAQRTLRPLWPGTRPIALVDEGDLPAACEMSGWPGNQLCLWAGLSPRLDYGTKPQLVAVEPGRDGGYVAVLAYTDATDQATPRWVGLSITRACGRWCVEKFADLPFTDTPTAATASAVLANVDRCPPGGREC